MHRKSDFEKKVSRFKFPFFRRKPPIRNTPYVCLFDDDGLWYRAQYEAMFPGDEAGTKKVQVLFVDFGNRQTYSFPNEWITSAKVFSFHGLKMNFQDFKKSRSKSHKCFCLNFRDEIELIGTFFKI